MAKTKIKENYKITIKNCKDHLSGKIAISAAYRFIGDYDNPMYDKMKDCAYQYYGRIYWVWVTKTGNLIVRKMGK